MLLYQIFTYDNSVRPTYCNKSHGFLAKHAIIHTQKSTSHAEERAYRKCSN
jgi:predicted metalloprotease with PDZ domain